MPLPRYRHVPGQSPHPMSDPYGHRLMGLIFDEPPIDLTHWRASTAYRYAIDLFNHGFYWEAHEVWEGLWRGVGRRGMAADFLKGLIHLAAAGVKSRQGNPKGVVKHAERAKELFEIVGNSGLGEIGERLVANPSTDSTLTKVGHPVLGIRLELEQLTVG